MQMLDIITYSQSSPAAGSGGGPTEKPKNKDTFSDVLEQQVSQGKTDGDSTRPPQEGSVETKPEELPAETKPEVQNLAALLWLNQNPLVVQQPTVDAGIPQTTDVTAAIPTVEEPQVLQKPMTGEANKALTTAASETQELNLSQNSTAADGMELIKPQTAKEPSVPSDLNAEVPQAAKPIELPQGQQGKNEASLNNNAPKEETMTKTETTEQAPTDSRPLAGSEKKDADVVQIHQPVTANEQKVFTESVKTTTGPDIPQSKADLPSLSQTILDQVAKGKREFEIWLQPANLGKMAIKVAYEGGKAAISILCTNEKTMELISQNAKNLGTIIEQHTGTQTVVVIDKSETDYLQQQTEQQNQGGYPQEENQPDQTDQENETESLSFLQQLRLGLA